MRIEAYEHVGIRVSDRARAVAFYEMLGFEEELDLPAHHANEMTAGGRLRINLIFNGTAREGRSNVLQDEPVKWPGVTHVAFVVDDLSALERKLAEERVEITEGPIVIAGRRRTLFIRDPDGTVLEFNQILEETLG